MILKTVIHHALVPLRFSVSWDLNSIPLNGESNGGLRKHDTFSPRPLRDRNICSMFWNLSSSQCLFAMLYFSSTQTNKIVISDIARWSVCKWKD